MRYLAVSVALHLFFLGALKVTEREVSSPQRKIISVRRYFPERPVRRGGDIFPSRAGSVADALSGKYLPPFSMDEGNISSNTLNVRTGESEWPLYMPPPRYPRAAKENGWQGEVVFKLRTDPYGYIESLDILLSSGYALLDEEAYQTVKQWRMAPKLVAEIPIVFKLTE